MNSLEEEKHQPRQKNKENTNAEKKGKMWLGVTNRNGRCCDPKGKGQTDLDNPKNVPSTLPEATPKKVRTRKRAPSRKKKIKQLRVWPKLRKRFCNRAGKTMELLERD